MRTFFDAVHKSAAEFSQKKQRKERKREEELKKDPQQVMKTRFEKLVKKIRERGEKVQVPESKDLKSVLAVD